MFVLPIKKKKRNERKINQEIARLHEPLWCTIAREPCGKKFTVQIGRFNEIRRFNRHKTITNQINLIRFNRLIGVHLPPFLLCISNSWSQPNWCVAVHTRRLQSSSFPISNVFLLEIWTETKTTRRKAKAWWRSLYSCLQRRIEITIDSFFFPSFVGARYWRCCCGPHQPSFLSRAHARASFFFFLLLSSSNSLDKQTIYRSNMCCWPVACIVVMSLFFIYNTQIHVVS